MPCPNDIHVHILFLLCSLSISSFSSTYTLCCFWKNRSLELCMHLRICSLSCPSTLGMKLLRRCRQQTFVHSKKNTSMSHHHNHVSEVKEHGSSTKFLHVFYSYDSVKWTTKCYMDKECLVLDGEATTVLPEITPSKWQSSTCQVYCYSVLSI